MSDSGITNDCLHHYNSQHIQVRRDYFDLCVYDKCKFNQKLSRTGKKVKDEPNQECMAKIMRIMETLTDEERRAWYKKVMHAKDQGLKVSEIEPSEFPLPLAYHRICKLLYYTYGESVVRNSIAELIRRGYLKCSQATKNSIPVYVFNVKVVQNALRKQAQDKVNQQVLKSTATSEDEHENQADEAGVEIDSQASEINTSECEIDSQASEINTINNYRNNLGNNPSEMSFSSSHGSDDAQPSLSEVLEQLRAIQQENARLREEISSLSQQRQPEASLERTKASNKLSTGGQSVEKSTSDVPEENSDPIATKTTKPEQQKLLQAETPVQENTPPVMPPAEMKWGPEKLVQITEALRFYRNKQGARFTTECTGKGDKSQRQRQLEAAKKIISHGVTELQYVRAYTKRNDAWWNDNKGSLTVVRMAENTPRKVMRTLEILEEMESQPSKGHRQYNATGNTSPDSQQPTGKLVAATPGSQYIVDELQSRYEDNYNAWLASEEGQACMREAEAEEQRQAQLAAVGGR